MKSIELYVDEYGNLKLVYKENGLATEIDEVVQWDMSKYSTGSKVFTFLDLKEV